MKMLFSQFPFVVRNDEAQGEAVVVNYFQGCCRTAFLIGCTKDAFADVLIEALGYLLDRSPVGWQGGLVVVQRNRVRLSCPAFRTMYCE
jgi:hypothetical protein